MLQIFKQEINCINSIIKSYLSSLYYDSGQEIEKNAPLQQNDIMDPKTRYRLKKQ